MGRRCFGILLCLLLALLLLGGCSSSKVIRMDLPGPVENLDPQYATDEVARMILLNVGEGLMTLDGQGAPVLGVAEDWQLSSDGSRYTFTLREDARWEDGEPVLAGEFVFAFQRLFTPGALSPYAQELSMLEGASDLLEGKGSLSRLGVTAPDEQTIVFSLSHPSADFLRLLASSWALPCREEFFQESRGRYGLELKCQLSNGPFQIDRWDNAKSLQLERNDQYRDAGSVLPDRVVFYIGRQNPVGQFLDGKSDLAQIPRSSLSQLDGKAQITSNQGTVWAIVFHQRDSIWGNPLLRQGLAHTLEPSLYQEELPSGLSPTAVFLPPTVGMDGASYREYAGEESPLVRNPEWGGYLFETGLASLGLDSLSRQAVLLVPAEHQGIQQLVAQSWQKHLGIHVSVQAQEAENLRARLQQGDFQMMLLPFSSSDGAPQSLLHLFASDSPFNHAAYQNPRYDAILASAALRDDPLEALEAYRLAEELLLTDGVVIPLYREETHYAIAPGLSGIEILPYGNLIRFSGGTREG